MMKLSDRLESAAHCGWKVTDNMVEACRKLEERLAVSEREQLEKLYEQASHPREMANDLVKEMVTA